MIKKEKQEDVLSTKNGRVGKSKISSFKLSLRLCVIHESNKKNPFTIECLFHNSMVFSDFATVNAE